MSADESRSEVRRGRPVERVPLPVGPLRGLNDAIYRLYAEADCPRLDDLAAVIAADDTLPGSPRKDLIGKIIGGDGLASQQDTVTVATALARDAGRRDVEAVAASVRELWIAARTAPPASPPARLGRPIADCDPFDLEVHPAVEVAGRNVQPVERLPAYVRRAHDEQLRQIASAVLAGESRLVTLVGSSSTGKTRACWELARYVDREQPGRWRVWHPYDPTRPEAAAAAMELVGAYTIVWLNEAQFYLTPPGGGLGERIAAGLRALLRDPGRAPVLVLATLWPQYWSALTARGHDSHGQSGELLVGTRVTVADTFTAGELDRLRDAGDGRLRQAASAAGDGRITQYLAGAPELEGRYRTAPPAARAIIQVAIDAYRLGHPQGLSYELLEQAAPGYLDDHDWDALGEDWLEQALTYTGEPCKGARGPLTRIRPRTGSGPGLRLYRLADYLEQQGRRERQGAFPPSTLWTAFGGTVQDAGLLTRLGGIAENRGRFQHAVTMYSLATDLGDVDSLVCLAGLLDRAGDPAGAVSLRRQAAERGHYGAVQELAGRCVAVGDLAEAEGLYLAAIGRDSIHAVRDLVTLWLDNGDHEHAVQRAVAVADGGETRPLVELSRRAAADGDTAGADRLYELAAEHGDTDAMVVLASARSAAGDVAEAERLLRHASDLGSVPAMYRLALMLVGRGDPAGVEAVAVAAADRGNRNVLLFLAALRQFGDPPTAEQLNWLAFSLDLVPVSGIVMGTGGGGFNILGGLVAKEAADAERAGDLVGAEAKFRRAVDLGRLKALADVVRLREQAGDVIAASRLRRFGMDGAGEPGTSLDFGRYGGWIGGDWGTSPP
jgi:TPR repeat protein